MEKAFWSPAELARRLGGSLDAASIAAMDPDELAAVFKERPALHRYPGSMAGRVQEVCRAVAEEYGGQADAIWKGVRSGDELVDRLTSCRASASRRRRSSPPCWASSSACARTAGARPPRPTATSAPTCRWPTSPTPESLAQGPDDQAGHEGQGARRRVSRRPRPRRAAASTCARRTAPTWPPSSRRASRAGWTSCSCATRSSRPGRCWNGRAWWPRCAATTACPSCSTTGPTWRSSRRGRRRPRGPGRRPGRAGPTHPWARRHRRPVHPLRPEDLAAAASEDVTYISAGPVEATPDQARPARDRARLRQSGQRTLHVFPCS